MSNKISVDELSRLAYLSQIIKQYQEEESRLKDKVRSDFPAGDTFIETVGGTLLVSVTPTDVLDPEFSDKFPEEANPQFYKTVPDTKAIQKETKKAHYVPGTSRVSVKQSS